jgi:hypothetical protein
MGGAESKREQQPIKATPKVQTMKACIVSMEYTIKNNDGTPKLPELSKMYSDGEKVKQLFQYSLGWDKDDV